jgi:hypothetical protein
MVRKTDDEKLQELEEKIAQIKAQKQQLANRIQTKERKERTRRLIQVGAIFEKYFDIVGEVQAEKVAYGLKDRAILHKNDLLRIDIEKSKEQNKIVYEEQEEKLIIPKNQETPYATNPPENHTGFRLRSSNQLNIEN